MDLYRDVITFLFQSVEFLLDALWVWIVQILSKNVV